MKKSFATNNLFIENAVDIRADNAFLLTRIAIGASIMMLVLSFASPFLEGFSASAVLYAICAAVSTAFSAFCVMLLQKCMRAVLPLFYAFLGVLCTYAILLSCFFYPNIHGVTIIGIYMLVPMVILDKSWRVNLIFVIYFLVGAIITLLNKPIALAIDDIATCGCFVIFGILIGGFMRMARLRGIEQRRQLAIQREQLETERYYDTLTGLLNRRSLFERLSVDDAGKNAQPAIGMAMVDIDFFKQYNNAYGHAAGDECLRSFGLLLKSFAAENSVDIYRFSGKKFLLLDCFRGEEQLEELTLSLLQRARAVSIPYSMLTVSIGYTVYVDDKRRSSELLIEQAEKALVIAKRLGRDRAERYSETADAIKPPPIYIRRTKRIE